MRRCAIALVLVVACHQQGTGIGSLKAPLGEAEAKGTVVFSWRHGADPSHGQMNARLSDGTELRGTFTQVKEAIHVTRLDVSGEQWAVGHWALGPPGEAFPHRDYVTGYSRTLLARLRSSAGVRMQCSFVLADPVKGLRLGADGKCMLIDRERTTYSTMVARVPS